MRHLLHILLPLLLLSVLVGCYRRDLWVYKNDTLRVRLCVDWDAFEEETPTGFTAIFYPHDTAQQPITVISSDISGCYVNLPIGIYDVVLFNQIESEYSNQKFRGMETFPTTEVYVLPLEEQPSRNSFLYGPVRKAPTTTDSGTDDDDNAITTMLEGVYEQPEYMAVDTLRNLNISRLTGETTKLVLYEDRDLYDDTEEEIEIWMHPKSIVWTMRVNAYVAGIDNFQAIRGSVQGLAEGFLMGKMKHNTFGVTYMLNDWGGTRVRGNDLTDGMLWIDFNTFGMKGLDSYRPEDLMLNLQILLKDQTSVINVQLPIADVVSVDTLHRHLEHTVWPPIDLPDVDEKNPSNFEVDVKPWEEEEVEISM